MTALDTLAPSTAYPLVLTKGKPFERGVQYGTQARSRLAHTLAAYGELFREYAALSWPEVCRYAVHYEEVIQAFDPRMIEEMRGIASGGQVDFADILAINVRSEVMYGVGELRAAADCTAFVATSPATANGHSILGQNWDWHPAAFESCVVLSIEQDDGPDIVTVVEAGLLSKMGMNSAGLGVVTNAMVTDLDHGDLGVPYHALLRAIQNETSVENAVKVVTDAHRASSANYLIADRSGSAIDLEVAPGDSDRVFRIEPVDGVLGHANCFVSPNATVHDQTAIRKPVSITRQRTIDARLSTNLGNISVELMQEILADHEHHPNALCRHPIERFAPIDRSATVASVIMDLETLDFWVADGQPCSHPYTRLEPSKVWPQRNTAGGENAA